ncbi:hypothetical protein ACHAWF_010298 [Thalassiosira exigua]
MDEHGRFKMLLFFTNLSSYLPTLAILAQCEDSRRVVEVGCERFFGLPGYASSPRRSRLNVCTYERVAMLATILNRVYIDDEWVAKEYLRRCHEGLWKEESTTEALKCWNLERVLEAQSLGRESPKDITLAQLIGEENDADKE